MIKSEVVFIHARLAAKGTIPRPKCLLGILNAQQIDRLGVKRILSKDLEVTLMISFELIQISMLSEALNFLTIWIVFVIQIVGLDFQILETFLNQS